MKMINKKIMQKYLVVLDFKLGALKVFNGAYEDGNLISEKKYGVKDIDCIWGYYDELPDFDESLTLDCGDSYKYLTIFDFTQNKGIVIPITENQYKSINNKKVEEFCLQYKLYPNSEWMITEDSEIYFNTIGV